MIERGAAEGTAVGYPCGTTSRLNHELYGEDRLRGTARADLHAFSV